MKRYQVKAGVRGAWSDRGPDLLRRPESAVGAVADLCRSRRETWVGRTISDKAADVEWETIGKHRRLEAWLSEALERARDGDRVQVGYRRWDDVNIRAVVRTRGIDLERLDGAKPGTELANALFAAAWPGSIFAGAYVCKETSPGYWSDHGWGDAVDRTSTKSAPNDAMTDWGARMAATGDLPCAYLLGSRDGTVVEAKRRLVGSYRLKPSSSSTSHLWHVHVSIRDHGGARPPCA